MKLNLFLCIIMTFTFAILCSCAKEQIDICDHDYSEVIRDDAHIKYSAKDCTETNAYWYDCLWCDSIAGDNLSLDKWYESNEIGDHNISSDWCSEGNEHFHKCVNSGCSFTDGRAECYGGNATCITYAICEVCANTYGELGGHLYDESAWGYSDVDGHAHKCLYCPKTDSPLPHTPSIEQATEDNEKTCVDCGYVIESAQPHVHSQSTSFEFDNVNHWHDCVKNDGQVYDIGSHTFDNECDTDCNDGCGYIRGVNHDYSKIMSNDEEHWYECSVCNHEKQNSRVKHTYSAMTVTEPKTFTEGLTKHTCSCGVKYDEILAPTKTLKILAIGNSFAIDALTHLPKVAKAAGVENIVLGYIHYSGCSLAQHYEHMTTDSAVYAFALSNDAGNSMVSYNNQEKVTAGFAIGYTDWDYITLQQASHDSGVASTYAILDSVIGYVRTINAEAELYWHMTWAYQSGSSHSGFANYGNDQLTMYNAIVDVAKAEILTNSSFVGVIPSGTTIQNLRNSHLGDTLTRDGYHLTTGIGRYAAAVTYLVAITGYDLDKFNPTGLAADVSSHLPCITEAVRNAISKPFEITPSEKYPFVEPEPPAEEKSTTSPLTAEDAEYLTSMGYDPDGYVVLDLVFTENAYYDSRTWFTPHSPSSSNNLYRKYLASQVISKDELANGTLIRVADGYKFRADGWASGVYNTADTRPDYNASQLTVVDDAWWGSFDFRGFNLLRNSGTISIDEADALRIYVPSSGKLGRLNQEDISYLLSIGENPDDYRVYNFDYTVRGYYNSTEGSHVNTTHGTLSPKFIATEIFTKDILTNGSIIRVKSGYKYRADGWITLNSLNTKETRPAETTAEHVRIDDDWWGTFNYRGFNISSTQSNHEMNEDEATVLRIYIKVN